MARAWFFLVLLNSSSFSATRLSISCLTLASSSWERRTLFSSISRVASASSRAPWSSSFSCSSMRRCLSRAWMERPPSPSWSSRSLISSARFLFSRLTRSSCSTDSCWAAFRRNSSEEKLRPSSWEAPISAARSAALDCHSPRTLSKFLARFSVIRAAACTLSYSMEMSSRSVASLPLDFSALATLVLRTSTSSSFSTILDCSLLRAPSSSSMRPMPSVSKRDFHSWISAWDLDRALRASDLRMASFSSFSLMFSRSVDIILYLVSREARSLASASDRALVSSSWVVTEILALFMLAIAFSSSSICLLRSWFSTWRRFLVDSASLRALAISSSLEQLALLVKLSLALDSIFQVQTSIAQVELKASLVLLGLDLAAIEAVNLLTKISHGVVVLHAESSQCSLLSNVELLKLSLQSGELTLTLLVKLNLGGSVGTSLLKTGRNVLNVLLEHGAALLSLGTVASLNIEFLFKLLNAGHQFLGLLGVLGSKSGLIINLGRESAGLLLLTGHSTKQLSLDTLKIGDGLLGQLKVSLQD